MPSDAEPSDTEVPGEVPGGGRLAGYRLLDEIGRGGMAVVYRAEDQQLGRTVAVKVLAPRWAGDENFRRRFERESRMAAAIDHPHIIPVYQAGEAAGVLFIAMRYVEGRDLRVLLDRTGPLPVGHVARIAGQVASALDAAHAHQLVHRDVKPGNILVAEGTDGEHPEHIYLTDFGLTKKSLASSGITRIGMFVGTPCYAAPEQVAGRPLDGQCDQYSLACVVHELLTGKPPFTGDDQTVLEAHVYEPPPATGLGAAVDAVLARALAKEPADRYRSCAAFVAALRAVGERVPLAPPAWAAAVFVPLPGG
jgi:serine/threonine protein kinase